MKSLHNQSWHDSTHTAAEEKRHYERLDKELAKCTKSHYVMGSLFWAYVPDAIVVVPDKVLRTRVAMRPDLTYVDAKRVENVLLTIAKGNKVPVFDNFATASAFILKER